MSSEWGPAPIGGPAPISDRHFTHDITAGSQNTLDNKQPVLVSLSYGTGALLGSLQTAYVCSNQRVSLLIQTNVFAYLSNVF